MNGGFLITFEGGEGAGKTTQIALLESALRTRGYSVSSLRCPGGEPIAESIRSVLLHATSLVTAETELLLFAAARAQVTENVIRPRLADGQIVIMDRFIDSSVVYQGHARGLSPDVARHLNSFATRGLMPDLTILIEVDPEKGLGRQGERNRMEEESLAFHQRVHAGYLEEARLSPERICVIDGNGTIERIHTDVVSVVLDRLDADTGGEIT